MLLRVALHQWLRAFDMSRICLISFTVLLACARAYQDSSPPHQEIPPKKVAASEGVTATLRCLFNGKTPPKITWKFRQTSFLLQDENLGTRYEYSVPKESAPRTDKRYNWVHEQFTPCSATCGGGFQTRNVTCRSQEELEIVEDSLCDEGLKPPTNQSCNTDSCLAQWVEGPWGECSQICGSGGVRSREVTCQKIIAKGAKPIVPDKECFDLLGPKPEVFQKCNEHAPCPTWLVGRWRSCDKVCGEGKQTRLVVCYQENKGRPIELLDDENCTQKKPEEEQPCMMQPCEVEWVTSSWSGCDTCTSKFRTRMVVCATENGLAMNESFCRNSNRPVDHEKCNKDELPTCEVQWHTTDWSHCSVYCGEGVQTRKVYCGMYYDDASGGGVKMVEDSQCANLTKYNDTKPCTVPEEECSSQWFAGTWSECSEKGEQFRRVMCFRGNKKAADCNVTTVLNSVQPCNPRTYGSDVPVTPQAVPPKETDPAASGGEVTIDGNAGHYRLTSDGALEIVSLYRNDTGVYVCVADNGRGVATQEIHLVVNEPVRKPAGIAGGENAWVIGELDRPFQVCCSAYGYPPPSVKWYKRHTLLNNNTEYEPRGNVLLIRNLTMRNLGTYTCGANNEVGQAASWKVVVQAYVPEGLFTPTKLLVPRGTVAPSFGTQCLTTAETTTTESSTEGGLTETTENTTGASDVETSTLSTTNEGSTVSSEPVRIAGENAWVIGELYRPFQVCCSPNGYPPSSVEWYRSNKGNTLLHNDTEYEPRENVLLIRNLTMNNLGTYTCGANNGKGQPASWKVVVRAYKPEGLLSDHEVFVPRGTVAPSLGFQCPTNAETTTTTTLRTTEAPTVTGRQGEGYTGPCSTSPYGCCQDDKTPAHGPVFEGCCLLQQAAFGCCPDNRKPAEGPYLEGCGCQYALHGCCPDNVTIAQGPDNQGCGCQYTGHGCCPDRHTAASGPNNEGCACNTFQFGCCADGVTTATGPDQQGCHCRDSKFRCCGDGETPAIGPDGAGCDCSSSRHRCCPDGRTEATGPKFLGCTDAPENKQAACSMSADPGPCHNFTAIWYYDLAYGGCSCFRYGGCDGNGNRFSNKEECENVCVQPSPEDACKLPSVKGACNMDYRHWYYNSTLEQCIPFRYGGCLGNANNFDTRELCQKQCEPSTAEGQCNLPIDQGSCAGNYSRWGFNSEAHRCEQFIWGGCEGNSNRFSSEAACQMRCVGTQPPQCTQPQEAGKCTEKEALWSFSQSENRCLPFYYSGCGGNDNRFSSREACEQTCPSAYVADKCTLPAETGECSNYRERWFYDTTFKRCRQFYYGGCGGNENNFGTEAECDNSCSEIKTTTTTTTTTTTASPVKPQPEPSPQVTDQIPAAPDRSEFCFNAIDAGPCNNTETRYAYDSELGRCVTFQYGGCAGNQNNFPDEDYCSYYCQPMQDVCQLPMLQGPCDDSLMRWFYDPTTDSCNQFTYGGCEGNDNRFESFEACENQCRTGPAPVAPTTPTTTVIVDGPPECIVPEALEGCRYGGEVWFFDPSRHECVSHANQEAGPVCRHTGTFSSQEACERSCGTFQGVDVCKQRLDAGPCQSYVTKVYFNSSTGQCHEFAYGGCLGGANRFSSIEECSQVCKSEIADPCTLPAEGGNCKLYVGQWYYDPSRDQCSQFVYSGCGGNENRFETLRDCEARCSTRPAATNTTTVATPPEQLAESECKTPSSLAPCGNNVTVFYYDSERWQCVVSGIGGCGHPNSYSTEEECERSCGAFRGLDVCGALMDPGPCLASIPKIYWDALTSSCQPFAYGGCLGGPNRFSSVEECMNVCGDTGPDQNNELPPDCTAYRQQCETPNCQYGVESFTENGCQRCICREDPCVRANCQPTERCEPFAVRNPASQEPVYSARCVAETNEVYVDCDEYVANCSRLRCEYGVQRVRLPDGCENCSCVQEEMDCEPLRQECNQLKCNYGVERIVGTDGCERCKCKEYPCETTSCGASERCVVNQYVIGLGSAPKYTAECRTIVKAGACPMDETTTNEVNCRHECRDDADCRGVGKCCRRGCSVLCLVPVEQTSPHPLLTTTVAPNVPAAPLALPQSKPEVEASEGGLATLRCLFQGNPPPKITWTFGELTINGNEGRYRLTSDGALEIVSLYRNDTGVYICVADNGRGVATQEIQLVVKAPVRLPTGIAGDENAVVTGELGRPLEVRCLAYGYPLPSVFWYRGYNGAMVPYNDAVYLVTGNVLLIRSLAIETLGQYTCQAYNGEGKAASWVVFVRAYQPEELFFENELLVPRNTFPPRPRTPPPTTAETTITTTTTTEAPRPLFTDTVIPAKCTDNPFANCNLIVNSKFCRHSYYSKSCCKSCVKAGQLDLQDVELQADQPRKK